MSDIGPLRGYTIGITAARRREELGMALERRGAKIVYAPAIRIIPLADDTDMLASTNRCLAAPPDIVVVTTGIGFRGWIEIGKHTSELQSPYDFVCRLLLEKKNNFRFDEIAPTEHDNDPLYMFER